MVQAYLKHHIAEGEVWIKVIPLAKVIERKGNTSIPFVTEAHLPPMESKVYIFRSDSKYNFKHDYSQMVYMFLFTFVVVSEVSLSLLQSWFEC